MSGYTRNKLEDLLTIESFKDQDSFIEEYHMSETVPGICMSPSCDYTTLVEPDQSAGWCEDCERNSVISGLILAGVI